MAQIRPLQIAPVNYGDANRLLALGQQQISGGLSGLQNALAGYRDNVVQQNTANALGILTGAKDLNDLSARQQQVQQVLQGARGDIDTNAIQKAQLSMPDTLLGRQLSQGKLTELANQQHDQPLLNQAMQLYAAGDAAGAGKILSGVQGDASRAVAFGAQRQDAATDNQFKERSLGLQAQGLALRQQAAAQRAAGIKGQANQAANLLRAITDINANAGIANTDAAVESANSQLKDKIKDSALNNSKANVDAWVSQANDDSGVLGFSGSKGSKLQNYMKQLDPDNKLTNAQRINLLEGMKGAFDSNDSFFGGSNPDQAALSWGRQALDDLQKSQKQELKNTSKKIENKRVTKLQRQQVLLQSLLNNGGAGNPALLNLLDDDED